MTESWGHQQGQAPITYRVLFPTSSPIKPKEKSDDLGCRDLTLSPSDHGYTMQPPEPSFQAFCSFHAGNEVLSSTAQHKAWRLDAQKPKVLNVKHCSPRGSQAHLLLARLMLKIASTLCFCEKGLAGGGAGTLGLRRNLKQGEAGFRDGLVSSGDGRLPPYSDSCWLPGVVEEIPASEVCHREVEQIKSGSSGSLL